MDNDMNMKDQVMGGDADGEETEESEATTLEENGMHVVTEGEAGASDEDDSDEDDSDEDEDEDFEDEEEDGEEDEDDEEEDEDAE